MSVWTDRDLPVLLALAEPSDEHLALGYLSLGDGHGAGALGLDLDEMEIADSLLTLREADYVQFTDAQETGGPNLHLAGLAITGSGLQAPATTVRVIARNKEEAAELTATARELGLIAAHNGNRNWMEAHDTLPRVRRAILEHPSRFLKVITLWEPQTRTLERMIQPKDATRKT